MCKSVIPLTDECKRINNILKILFICNTVIVITKLILGDIKSLYSNLIVLLLFFSTFQICHFLLAGYLIFFMLFNLFYSIIFIGLRFQNKLSGVTELSDNNTLKAFIVLEVLSSIIYVVSIIYSFKAYKEFKAISLNGGGYSKIIFNN
jgi:hypothetical protein